MFRRIDYVAQFIWVSIGLSFGLAVRAQESLPGEVVNPSSISVATEPPMMPDVIELPLPDPASYPCPPPTKTSIDRRLNVEYDDGFVFTPVDSKRTPYELRVRGWTQLRHHAMFQDRESWTDNAGTVFPLRDRNFFDIERARLLFSGYAIDKRLTYLIHLDGDTDGADAVDFFDHWWAWQATDRVNVAFGKRKLPGSRQWLLSARHTRFADRPMVCDFMRPDRTIGIAATGQLTERIYYDAMVSNGYRTANLLEGQHDNRVAFAFNSYIDPFGPFGNLLVDYDDSDELLTRIGYSLVTSSQVKSIRFFRSKRSTRFDWPTERV